MSLQSIYVVVIFDERGKKIFEYAGPPDGEVYIDHPRTPYGVPYKYWESGASELVNWIKHEKQGPVWTVHEQVFEVKVEVLDGSLQVDFKPKT